MARSRLAVLAFALAFATILTTASAAKFDAQNAKKVDGIKATKYTTSAKKRKGKLVATNKQGLLPDNIVGLVAAATHAQSADTASALSCTGCIGASELPGSPSAGQVLGFNGSNLAWQGTNAGTITDITTSGGLTGGGTSGSVNVGVDATQLQNRVSGNCASGSALQSVNQDGTVACGTTAPSGSAGGALSGSYPNPTLNVSGGDASATACKNGEALTGLSAGAALTCSPGVYSDSSQNVAAGPTPFPALSTGARNSALGTNALAANTSGNDNAAVGTNALSAFDSGGGGDSALGSGALQNDTTGTDNSAVGFAALNADTNGSSNTAVGKSALSQETSGNSNSALGVAALTHDNTGTDNAAVGQDALFDNTGGGNNSAFGLEALFENTTGNNNTALGEFALFNGTTGSNNTALGETAGASLTTGSNNVDINNNGVNGESNVTRIGTAGSQSKAFLAGVRGVTTDNNNAVAVMVDSAGQLGTVSSSRRYKTDIRRLRAHRLMALRPVRFHYKKYVGTPQDKAQYGLIAEQVAKVYPNLVAYDHNGRPQTVMYQELPALLLAQAQRQHAQAKRQHAALRRQRGRNRTQSTQIASLRRTVRRLARRR